MFRSRMLHQFFGWYVILIALPALLLTSFAYQNVRNYAQSEIQSGLTFDLERAAAAADRILETAQHNMQSMIASRDIYQVLLSMCTDARSGQIAFARYTGEFKLRSLLEPVLFQDEAVADVIFFAEDRCLFSYNHYVPSDAALSSLGVSRDAQWLGRVENPFGIAGEYLLLQGFIQDYASGAQQVLCTIVLLINQDDIVHILDENARYEDNMSALLGPDGILVLNSTAAQSPDLIEQAAALGPSFGQEPDTLHSGDHAISMDACTVASDITDLRYIQLSSSDHSSAYALPVLALIISWAALSLLAVVLFALLVSRRIIRPTIRLASTMTRLTASDLDIQLPSPGVCNELEDVYDGFNSMLVRLKESIVRTRLSEKEKRHYQLGMLKYQINPHFLYNTINSIRFSCLKSGDKASAQMLITLSRLLRNTLDNPTEMIDLSDEVNNLRDFVSLQQIRYEHGLDFQILLPDELKDVQVPIMILQPIVENAITHGLNAALNAGKDARITLSARSETSVLLLTIEDNGEGIGEMEMRNIFSEEKRGHIRSSHIGLANIHHRLQLMFGEEYGISLESRINEFTRVTLRLPVLERTEDSKGGENDVSGHAGGR